MFYLRDIRKANNLTMKELGEKVGLSESAIGMYETGRRQPNYEMLLKLSEALGCSVADLLHGYGYEEDPLSPSQRMLFNKIKGWSEEDIQQAIRIVEALKK